MARFDQLPTELVDEIITIVHQEYDGFEDLRALRQTHRLFWPSVDPILFATAVVSFSKRDYDRFLKLAHSPHLRRWITRLVWYEVWSSLDTPAPLSRLPEEEVQLRQMLLQMARDSLWVSQAPSMVLTRIDSDDLLRIAELSRAIQLLHNLEEISIQRMPIDRVLSTQDGYSLEAGFLEPAADGPVERGPQVEDEENDNDNNNDNNDNSLVDYGTGTRDIKGVPLLKSDVLGPLSSKIRSLHVEDMLGHLSLTYSTNVALLDGLTTVDLRVGSKRDIPWATLPLCRNVRYLRLELVGHAGTVPDGSCNMDPAFLANPQMPLLESLYLAYFDLDRDAFCNFVQCFATNLRNMVIFDCFPFDGRMVRRLAAVPELKNLQTLRVFQSAGCSDRIEEPNWNRESDAQLVAFLNNETDVFPDHLNRVKLNTGPETRIFDVHRAPNFAYLEMADKWEHILEMQRYGEETVAYPPENLAYIKSWLESVAAEEAALEDSLPDIVDTSEAAQHRLLREKAADKRNTRRNKNETTYWRWGKKHRNVFYWKTDDPKNSYPTVAWRFTREKVQEDGSHIVESGVGVDPLDYFSEWDSEWNCEEEEEDEEGVEEEEENKEEEEPGEGKEKEKTKEDDQYANIVHMYAEPVVYSDEFEIFVAHQSDSGHSFEPDCELYEYHNGEERRWMP